MGVQYRKASVQSLLYICVTNIPQKMGLSNWFKKLCSRSADLAPGIHCIFLTLEAGSVHKRKEKENMKLQIFLASFYFLTVAKQFCLMSVC